uniref:Uncharacterized protein n=1 Tax=Arundo donax TaxID=35708 RepID=A0A0A8XWP8_ARUDO
MWLRVPGDRLLVWMCFNQI